MMSKIYFTTQIDTFLNSIFLIIIFLNLFPIYSPQERMEREERDSEVDSNASDDMDGASSVMSVEEESA